MVKCDVHSTGCDFRRKVCGEMSRQYIPRDVTLGANNVTFKVMGRVISEKKNNHHNIRNLQFGLEQSFQATKLYRPFV